MFHPTAESKLPTLVAVQSYDGRLTGYSELTVARIVSSGFKL